MTRNTLVLPRTFKVADPSSLLNSIFTRAVGFDPLLARMQAAFDQIDHADNFPPHNVIKLAEGQYVIELAVAGFTQKDLLVERKADMITVTGNKNEKAEQSDNINYGYLHRGIANRAFTRTWPVSEHAIVSDVTLENGILSIKVEVETPKESIAKTFPINVK